MSWCEGKNSELGSPLKTLRYLQKFVENGIKRQEHFNAKYFEIKGSQSSQKINTESRYKLSCQAANLPHWHPMWALAPFPAVALSTQFAANEPGKCGQWEMVQVFGPQHPSKWVGFLVAGPHCWGHLRNEPTNRKGCVCVCCA